MQEQTKRALGAALIAAGIVLAPTGAQAQAESARVTAASEAQQRSEFQRLLDSTKALNQALKRVSEERKVDQARLVRENELKIQKAEGAAAAGRLAEARVTLDEAYLACKQGIADVAKKAPGAARPAPTGAGGDGAAAQKTYAARMESTKALRGALERVAQEKNDAAAKAELPVIDKLMKDADAKVAANEQQHGRALLDHAYLRAKVQIERMRGGETLVRTLHFDTKDAEFHYEQDRNDTYRMLIPLLVPNGSELEGRMKDFLERGQKLRSEADAKAGNDDYEAALKLIDQSTDEYKKVIRNAGVLLPG